MEVVVIPSSVSKNKQLFSSRQSLSYLPIINTLANISHPLPNTAMQSYRITAALPRACRPLTIAPTRAISTHFPPFISSDFAPLWRLLDDSLRLQTAATPHRHATRVVHPRFDVREAANSYELHGELPGIRQEDLDIQFVDPHTLVIKGRTEREFSRNTPAETENTTAAAPAESSTETAPQSSPSYHKATIEDDYVDASATSSSSSVPPTPTSSTPTETAPAEASPSANAVTNKAEPEYKYWINERSIGEFTRTFQFPGTVDQEAVKASLKNGILSVVVPKLVRAERRIVVE